MISRPIASCSRRCDEPLLHLVRNTVDHGIESPSPLASRRKAARRRDTYSREEAPWRPACVTIYPSDGARPRYRRDRSRARAARTLIPSDAHAVARTIFDEGFTTRDTATTYPAEAWVWGSCAPPRNDGAARSTLHPARVRHRVHRRRSTEHRDHACRARPGWRCHPRCRALSSCASHARSAEVRRVDGRVVLVAGGTPTPVTTLAALLGPPFEEPSASAMLQVVLLESGGRRTRGRRR